MVTLSNHIREHELFQVYRSAVERGAKLAALHRIAEDVAQYAPGMTPRQIRNEVAKASKRSCRMGRPPKDKSMACACPRCGAGLIIWP